MVVGLVHLPHEPIVLLQLDHTNTGLFPAAETMRSALDRLAGDGEPPLYVIVDLRGREVDASGILLMVLDAEANPLGSVLDPRIRPIAVGEHPMIPVGIRRLHQMTGVVADHFGTFDEALSFARAELGQCSRSMRG